MPSRCAAALVFALASACGGASTAADDAPVPVSSAAPPPAPAETAPPVDDTEPSPAAGVSAEDTTPAPSAVVAAAGPNEEAPLAGPDVAAREEQGPSASASIRKVGSTSYEIERALVDEVMRDPQRMGNLRLIPSFEEGNAVGFKFQGIRPGSMGASLGLEDGDIVHSVNGHDFTSPDKALEAYIAIREAETLRIELTRRDEPVSLTWHIVP